MIRLIAATIIIIFYYIRALLIESPDYMKQKPMSFLMKTSII